jgi:DNA polymerase-3 subunit beta
VPVNKQSGVRLPAVILREAIRRTAFAVTTEQSRFAVSGAKVMIDEDHLTMVATDGHRLAFARFPLVNSTGQKLDFLVPEKTLAQLVGLLEREVRRHTESQIEIGDTGNQLSFAVGGRSLFSRKLTGAFPNWEMVLPKNLDFTVEISTEDFRRTLARVTLTAEMRNRSVMMEIEPGKLTLKSGAAQGEAQEEMLAAFNGGGGQNAHALCFNSRYVQDFLQVLSKAGSPTFSLGFADGSSPFELFLPTERDGCRYVLMPLRV